LARARSAIPTLFVPCAQGGSRSVEAPLRPLAFVVAGKAPGIEHLAPRRTRFGSFAWCMPSQSELTRRRDTLCFGGRSANVVPTATTEPLFRTIAAPCALIAKFGRFPADLSVPCADVWFKQMATQPRPPDDRPCGEGTGGPTRSLADVSWTTSGSTNTVRTQWRT
jgi:hypothetical protein